MPSLFSLGYIDTSDMTSMLLTKRKSLLPAGMGRITLADDLVREWPTARRALIALRALSSRVNDGVTPNLSDPCIWRFAPGDTTVQWNRIPNHVVILPLVTGPGLMFYADAEFVTAVPGLSFCMASGALTTIANHGRHQALFVSADLVGDRDEIPDEAVSE